CFHGVYRMDYERGLEQIIRQARGKNWFQECALHEARLRGILDEERRYGITEQTRSSRTQIIDQLNSLAYKHLKASFVDLCIDKNIDQYLDTKHQFDVPTKQNVLNVPVQDISNIPARQLISEDVRYSSPVKVFVGYSHKDRNYLKELRVHLVPYIQANNI